MKTNLQKEEAANDLLDKMNAVIISADEKHKRVVARYLSLANKKLQYLMTDLDTPATFGLIGGSFAIKENFEIKFGTFCAESEPVFIKV